MGPLLEPLSPPDAFSHSGEEPRGCVGSNGLKCTLNLFMHAVERKSSGSPARENEQRPFSTMSYVSNSRRQLYG